jgi:hypothetical protein
MRSEAHVNRKQLIAGIAMFVILIIAGVGFLLARLLNKQPQVHQKLPVSALAYCNPLDIKPCIVSFSVDADGNMLVNMLTPKSAYPDFYLTISNDNLHNKYECRQVQDFPTNVYCSGKQIYPGEAFQFNVIAIEDDRVLAEGNFAVIGLLLPNPDTEPLVTAPPAPTEPPATEAPATEAPLILENLTPDPSYLNPSYPNPSYPNPSYP